jgi:phospholipid/cholesterol/gamma-HCH transport system substrate-binding protein
VSTKGTAIEVKVGALVLFSLALLVTFIVILGDFGLKEGVLLRIDYSDIGGLKPGASVKQAGIEIGKVQNIEYRGGQIDPETKQPVWARVTIEVDPQYAPSIRTSSEFFISAEGVLGEKFIGIQTVQLEAPEAKPGHTFKGVDPMRIEQMVAKVSKSLDGLESLLNNKDVPIGELVRHVDQLAVHVDELIVENRPQIKQIIASTGGLIDKASTAIDKTSTTIDHTDTTILHADTFILSAQETLTESRPRLRSILANVDTASSSAQETLRLANQTMRRIDDLAAKVDTNLQPVPNPNERWSCAALGARPRSLPPSQRLLRKRWGGFPSRTRRARGSMTWFCVVCTLLRLCARGSPLQRLRRWLSGGERDLAHNHKGMPQGRRSSRRSGERGWR